MQITDRSKDVIKSGGEWISSIDLENIAVAHPAVRGGGGDRRPPPEVGRAAAAGGGEEARRRRSRGGAAQVLRGQDRQVVDARRRGVRRPSCRTPPPASCSRPSCARTSRTTSCRPERARVVLASEEKLEKALRSAHTRERDQRQRLRWIAWIAASYALDTLFLAPVLGGRHRRRRRPAGLHGLAAAVICGGHLRVDRERPQPAAARPEPGHAADLRRGGAADRRGRAWRRSWPSRSSPTCSRCSPSA